MRQHGEKFTKTFHVNQGKNTCRKNMRYCALCGDVDLFLFPDFEIQHGSHDRSNGTHGTYVDIPKVFKKAA